MKIQQMKAGIFAIKKRLQGYELLKNPNGVPGTNVTVMQKLEWIDPFTLDIHKHFNVITKDFAMKDNPKIIKYFDVSHYAFFDAIKQQVTRCKYANYYQTSEPFDMQYVKEKEKGSISYEKLENRDLDYIDEVVFSRKESRIDLSKAFLGYAGVKDEIVEKTFGEILIEKYKKTKDKFFQNEYSKKGFWRTLISNLKQS